MPEKPVLVLIGEAHPSNIEQILILEGLLQVRAKEGSGMKRLVVDRSSNYALSKESIRRINEGILKKEAELLKKGRIARLLLESPASPEAKRMYDGFRRTHDLKELKNGLRKEAELLNSQTVHDSLGLFQELGLWKPLIDTFMAHYSELVESAVQHIFAFSRVTAAHRAGISDMVPVDDAKGNRQASALLIAMFLLEHIIRLFQQDMDEKGAAYNEEEAIWKITKDYLRIKNIVDKRLEQISMERVKAMCRDIVEHYIPGTALLCGIDHLEAMKEQLSKRFDLKIYRVGEELADAQ